MLRGALRPIVLALVATGASVFLEPGSGLATSYSLFGRPVRLDHDGTLASWSTSNSPYAHVAGLAWTALETKFPIQDNGLETWLTFSRFDPTTFEGVSWPHNPASFYAMLTDSAVLWYAFSGDAAAVRVARKALAYQIAHGTTPAGWDWARVPFASAGAGDLEYNGADDTWCNLCGRGDGIGVIEPDKVGELGFAYMQMFEATGDVVFRDAAVACADALAKHVRAGDEGASPWPFRVYAETNVAREQYSSDVIGALTLFDELDRLHIGDHDAYRHARTLALDWLLRVPLTNDAWSGYFEDVDIHTDVRTNINQYTPIRTARWLMAHRDADPQWRKHVRHILSWVVDRFGGDTPTERGVQWGATVMSEQHDDMVKMGSHTARFGATMALWFEATGDRDALRQGAASLNWATYACRRDGVVSVAEGSDEGWWFSDGYGDYIRHFLVAMAAVPEWAPARESHLLRSSSIVSHVEYRPNRVAWATFDAEADDTLRVAFRPKKVRVNGLSIPKRDALTESDIAGYTERALSGGDYLLQLRHGGREVTVSAGSP